MYSKINLNISISLIIGICTVLFSLYAYKHNLSKKQNSICFSNLRKMHQSIQVYINDYDQTFPTSQFWIEHAQKQFSIEGCPASWTKPNLKPPLDEGGVPGYSYNGILASGVFKLNQAKYPSFTIAIRDFTTGFPITFSRYAYPKHMGHPSILEKGWERHSGRGNYLFLDGHVRSLKAEWILEPETETCHTKGNQYTFCAD
jgi:prepilin-type processing-associated H-X9-DG protein